MRTSTILFIFLFIAGIIYSNPANSQASKRKLKRAENYFNRFEYSSAIPIYEKLNNSLDTSLLLVSRLAECYRLINQPEKAEGYYIKAVKFINVEPQLLYNYSSILKQNKKYKESDEWMDKYIKIKKDDELALHLLNSQTYVEKLIADSFKVEIEPVEVNSSFADWGPAYYKDQIVFSSSRITDNTNKKEKYGWNNEPFLDLYVADKEALGKLSNVKPFSKEINSPFHEGPVSFTDNYKTIYFTRNNYTKRLKEERTNKLKIYRGVYLNNKWDSIKSLWFNSDEYSCGHPTISNDGKRLFFTSDMPGGFGGTDIYVSYREKDEWGKPVNLGRNINTTGNEMFPYMHYNDTLFFASNGYKGLGGLDLFYSAPRNNAFEPPHSMGYPINSSMDDFALIMDQPKRSGYFSSNRKGSDDNIYKIRFYPNPPLAKVDTLTAYNNGSNYEIFPILNDSVGTVKLINICDYDSLSFKGMKVSFDRGSNMLIYNPPPGYTGTDTIRYTICDTLKVPLRANSYVIINVLGKKIVLKGLVTDKYNNSLIANTDIQLKDNYYNKITGAQTKTDGKYKFDVVDKNTYDLTFSHPGYTSEIRSISTKNLAKNVDTLEINVQLVPSFKTIVYFDLDKYTIRPDAKDTLDKKVLEFLKAYPNAILRMVGHTDARASFGYNDRLAKNRVNAVAKYLLKLGARPENTKVLESYGKYRMVKIAQDGVELSESEHQLNRRVEIEVYKW